MFRERSVGEDGNADTIERVHKFYDNPMDRQAPGGRGLPRS